MGGQSTKTDKKDGSIRASGRGEWNRRSSRPLVRYRRGGRGEEEGLKGVMAENKGDRAAAYRDIMRKKRGVVLGGILVLGKKRRGKKREQRIRVEKK